MMYFVKDDQTYLYPATTLAPASAKVTSFLGSQINIYTGSTVKRLASCYKVLTYGEPDLLNSTIVRQSLIAAWNQSHQGEKVIVEITKKENYFGDFGVNLAAIFYTVSLGGVPIEPDYVLEPAIQVLVSEMQASNINVYHFGASYRAVSLHTIKVEGSLSNTAKIQLETILSALWRNQSKISSNQNVSTSIVGYQEHVAMGTGSVVAKLSYSVRADNKVVLSWETQPLPVDDVTDAVTQLTNGMLDVFTNQTVLLSELYLKGESRDVYKNNEDIKSSVTTAWSTANNVSATEVDLKLVQVDTLAATRFVNTNWEPVTVVKYGISIDNKNGNSGRAIPPLSTNIMQQLQAVNLEEFNGVVLKSRKLYLTGTSQSQNFDAIQTSLTSAWIEPNDGLDQTTVKVSIKGQGQRNRRATSNTERFKLVGNNREDISPVKYTVQIWGQEPKEALVAQPDDATIDSNLQPAGTRTCGCIPKAEGQVMLLGKTPSTEKSKIQAALEKAVMTANSNLQAGDATVDTVTIEDTKDNENDISSVTYQVSCVNTSTCDIETLNAPSKVVLEKELSKVGKTLYSKAEPVEEEKKNKWLIPVAVACGVVLFLIILLVVCCIMYRKRHQKKGDFQQQEEDVNTKNVYDREHFSDAAVFENKAFVEGEIYKDRL